MDRKNIFMIKDEAYKKLLEKNKEYYENNKVERKNQMLKYYNNNK